MKTLIDRLPARSIRHYFGRAIITTIEIRRLYYIRFSIFTFRFHIDDDTGNKISFILPACCTYIRGLFIFKIDDYICWRIRARASEYIWPGLRTMKAYEINNNFIIFIKNTCLK